MYNFQVKSGLPEPIFNPYKPMHPKWVNNHLPPTVKGMFGPGTMRQFHMRKCCICGFYERSGVIDSHGFTCLKDFTNLDSFSPAKVILPNGLHINPKNSLMEYMKNE